MKIGMIGLDTSHCPAFTRILNDADHEYHLPGATVVSAYPGGSDQFSLSRDRVQGFTEQLQAEFGVKIEDSIPAVVEGVDAIFLESVDGRQHLEQFRQMAVGKPVFIDKPFAVSTADAEELIALAERTGTPIMSCSSLRYAAGIAYLPAVAETVVGCEAFGPAAILNDYPGLFWYGIHSAEILFAFMGTGCQRVRTIPCPALDVIIGEWADGRTGVIRGTRFEQNEFGCVVHTDSGVHLGKPAGTPPNYFSLLEQVLPFFQTGQSPISTREMFEIVAFLEAANRSREEDGSMVALQGE